MKHLTHISLNLLGILLALFLFCIELPQDPAENPKNADVTLFVRDNIIHQGDAPLIGVVFSFPQHFQNATVLTSCSNITSAVTTDTLKDNDTIYFNPRFETAGSCTVFVNARYRDSELRDKCDTLSVYILPSESGVQFITKPQPLRTTISKTDTLLYITKTSGDVTLPASYSLSVEPKDGIAITPLFSQNKDTLRIAVLPTNVGTYMVKVIASVVNGSLRLEDSAFTDVQISSSEVLAPSKVDIPQTIITGTTDTLIFIIDNSKSADRLSMDLVTDSPLDPAVFIKLPSGPDSILIKVASTKAIITKFGIRITNSNRSDTTWYTIKIITPDANFWNITSLEHNSVEGSLLKLDLSPYLITANSAGVSLSADVGTIDKTTWSFTPKWGCAEKQKVTIIAVKGDVSQSLTLHLTIAAGDTVKPKLNLVDPSLDGKKVSSTEITVECKVTDVGAGVDSVLFSYGTKKILGILQSDDIYSGLITGLVHNLPTQITATATDKSRQKNSAAITFTVSRDSTILDAEPPAIVKISGPETGSRVMVAKGNLIFTVNDNVGVDSVWWTLNDAFVSVVSTTGESKYPISYTFSNYGKNVIKLYAKDKSSAGNKGSQTVMLNYNTEPAAIVLTAPMANATDVSTSPAFKWSGGDDEDGDGVTFSVNYGTSQTNLSNTATVTGKTAVLSSPLTYAKTWYWQVTATSNSTAYSDKVQSNVGTFTTEGSVPTISAHPQALSIEVGQSVTFSVTAGGFGTLSYQWRLNKENITGATSSSYKITSVTTSMCNNSYDCVVKNEVGEVISNAAKLTVTEIPTFTVSFVTDGGTPKPNAQTITRGGLVTKPSVDPVRSGYRFTGWFELDAAHDFYFNQTIITANLTIYAGWKKQFTVTYNKNTDESGAVPSAPTLYDSGTVVTIAGNTGNLIKNGYQFKGWTTTPNGSGTALTTISAISDVNLYPKWEMIAPTITTPISDKTCPINDVVTFTVAATGPNLTYTWQLNGGTISNATGPTYTTTVLSVNDVSTPRTYKCIVTNSAGSKECSAKLSVSTVNDFDGNVYHQVKIGTLVWMMENLKTTHYRDGTAIKEITNATSWADYLDPAYCWYDYNVSGKAYGAYYNSWAARDKNIAPTGWRLPTETEWTSTLNLQDAEGMPFVSDDTYWNGSWTTSYNSTGFSAMGNGYNADGSFVYFKNNALWWASPWDERYIGLYWTNMGWKINVHDLNGEKGGFGIRCVKE